MIRTVRKYGGAALSSVERIEAIADDIASAKRLGQQMIVVVSAMGKETNRLLELAFQVDKNAPRRELDMLLTTGERISMSLLSIALNKRQCSARSLTGSQSGILTDDCHGNAHILEIKGDRIQSALDDGHVVIVAGFQGVSPRTKEITTLGRSGSDLTAVALAAKFKANHCQLYKDVPGFLFADPSFMKNSRIVDKLSWDEAVFAASRGAKILHHRAATLAAKEKVSIEIYNVNEPEKVVTTIQEGDFMETCTVKSIAHIPEVKTIRWSSNSVATDIAKIHRFLSENDITLFINQQNFKDSRCHFFHVIRSDDFDKYQDIISEVGAENLEIEESSMVSLVGQGLANDPHMTTNVFECIGNDCDHYTLETNGLTCLIPREKLQSVCKKLMDQFTS